MADAPAAILLEQLAAARRHGEDFEQAWPGALGAALQAADRAEQGAWLAAFSGTAESWREAFERHPPRRCELALAAVRDPDAVPLPDNRGRCGQCGADLPAGQRGRRYCSEACRHEAVLAEKRARRRRERARAFA